MKEITMITTAQITDIVKIADDFDFEKVKERAQNGGEIIKTYLGSDDAVVTDVQFFIRDIAEGEGADNGKVENAE